MQRPLKKLLYTIPSVLNTIVSSHNNKSFIWAVFEIDQILLPVICLAFIIFV